MSSSLLPHGLQCTRLPCPPLLHRVCSNSCPLSWWYYNHLILCCPLLLLPSIFPSIRVFASGIDWSFSFSSSPSSEYSGLISFRVYWFDLLAVLGALLSVVQIGQTWKQKQWTEDRETTSSQGCRLGEVQFLRGQENSQWL